MTRNTIHGPKAPKPPKNGGVSRCERCGNRIVARYIVPSRRYQWEHSAV